MQQKNSHEIEGGQKKKEVDSVSYIDTEHHQAEEEVEKSQIGSDDRVESENISEKNAVFAAHEKLERVIELLEVAHDKYVRLYAEFENYKKRVVKEKNIIIETANARILKEILSIVDDFERGIDSFQQENNNQYQAMQEGVKLIYDKLMRMLHQAGVQSMKIDRGDVFDVEYHEVIGQVSVSEEFMQGKIVNVVEKGYWLNEHVLRFAKVVIGS